ncbi:metallophosphoesterase [Rhodobacteraceae bacterium RKSG542]|nr:metallophosphoesterase [Pseudovibrio flavus]
MFKLAHISDPHLGPLPAVKPHQLLSKRILGYINWQKNRARTLTNTYLEGLVGDIHAHAPDHICVTGDLVNIALPDEIVAAGKWLEQLGTPENVSVIPGNHDAYVPGSVKKAQVSWSAYMSGDQNDDLPSLNQHPFPYIRYRGNVAIIGLSTARATGPFMATGHMSNAQLRALEDALKTLKDQGYFRIVMLHHPPVDGATSWYKRFAEAGKFRAVIAQNGAELILHGHTHLDTKMGIAGPNGKVPVICVPSASNSPGHHKPAARYNLFSISGEAGNWQCQLTERGFKDEHSGVVTIGEQSLAIPNS